MPVLVTGGAACIGRHVMLDAIDAGEEVIVLDNLSTGFAWAVQSGVSIMRGDAGNAAPESMPPKYTLPLRHRFAAEGNVVPIGSGRLLTAH
jgi:nucleoside-diphosphate-sugar epimerase